MFTLRLLYHLFGFQFSDYEIRECDVGFCHQQRCPLYKLKGLKSQENDMTKLEATFKIEDKFAVPIGKISKCSISLNVLDDDYKPLFKSLPKWSSLVSSMPEEIIVKEVLREANYKPTLQFHVLFDRDEVASISGKPSEMIYKCPGEVSCSSPIKL